MRLIIKCSDCGGGKVIMEWGGTCVENSGLLDARGTAKKISKPVGINQNIFNLAYFTLKSH